MVCVSGIGRIVLIVVNCTSALVGVAFIVLGCIIKYFIGDILKSGIIDTITKVAFALFVGNSPVPSSLDFGPLTDTVGAILIAVGSVLFLLSLLGCCVVCCSFKPLLISFCALLGILIIGQIIFYSLILTRNSVVHDKAKKTLEEDIITEYNRINVSSFTISADIIFLSAECCGVEGPEDFTNNTKMSFDFYHNGSTLTKKPLIPPSCCLRKYITALDWSCANNYTMGYSQGCYSRLQDLVEEWHPWLITVIVISLLVQIGEIVAAILIYEDE